MKLLKNKNFYIWTFLIYSFLMVIFYIFGEIFITPYAKSLLISATAPSRLNNYDIMEIIIDNQTRRNYDIDDKLFIKIFDYLHTYSKPKVIGFDIFDTGTNNTLEYVNQVSKMDNLVLAFVPGNNSESDNEFVQKFGQRYGLNINKDTPKIESTNSVNIAGNFILDNIKNFASVKVDSKDDNTQKL